MTEGRVTELPNALTADLDLATPMEILRLLQQADMQIFAGWRTFQGAHGLPALGFGA
jgi:hypothetical protein